MDAGPGDNEAGSRLHSVTALDDARRQDGVGPRLYRPLKRAPGIMKLVAAACVVCGVLRRATGWGGPASVQTMDAGPGDNEAGQSAEGCCLVENIQ
eukprot:768261-Hanusia_phi.AAC.1